MKRKANFIHLLSLLLIVSIIATTQEAAVFAEAAGESIVCLDDNDEISSNSVEQFSAQAALDGTTNIRVNVQYGQSEARKMTNMVNEFRQGDEAWAWDSTDTEKVYYSNLGTLTYDYKLEQLAMKRAAEIAFHFAHKHPDGSSIYPIPGGNYYAWGENICAGSNLDSAEAAFILWREDNCNHAGQGHRINMLGSWATGIGIGHVTLNGYHYWVMELGSPNSGLEATAADDGIGLVDLDISNDDITNVSVLPTQQSYTISGTDGVEAPEVKVTLKMAHSAFPNRGLPIVSQPAWTSRDETIAKIIDGRIYGIKAGSTSITTTVWGEEIIVPVNVEGQSANIPEGTPANPVHHCNTADGTQDTTTWSYIYFGSYPQSEITDSATITAIDNAIATSQAVADAGMDVWVNGTKYRRIGKNDTNHSGYFDNMPTSNGYRYFKWERIKWKVLRNDGDTLFVVADRAIDCKDYNEECVDITWETSTIRDWLNTSFYNTAFSGSEQNAIVTQKVVNEDNPFYGTKGGNDTSDKVYLLSISEVTDETYGFCSKVDTNSVSRRMKVSDYANSRGTFQSSDSGYEDNCWWWLRSPGRDSCDAAHVHLHGWVNRYGYYVNDNGDGVCPALHINLSSNIWSSTDDGTSGEGGNGGTDSKEEALKSLQAFKAKTEYMQGEALNLDDLTVTAAYENSTKQLSVGSYAVNKTGVDMDTPGSYALEISYTENGVTRKTAITITVKKNDGNTQQPDKDLEEGSPANPVHHCTKQNGSTDYTDFSYVYFGSYPQSEVTDSAAIAAIENAIAASGTAADVGMDVWVNGTKYRRINKNNTNFDGYFDDMPTSIGYRYFKWERIKWRVLRNDGNTLFVAADKAIDCKSYNEEAANVTWETSTLRGWLNNSFYNTAFSDNEQGAIVTKNVVNENNQEYETEGGNSTNDKICTLSISEVTDEKYGFCSDGDTSSISRRMKASDYANARGTLQSSSSGYEGNCWWWLRSPGFSQNYSANVNYYGWLNQYGYNSINSNGGICPSLHIKLSSDMWSTTDDGTSGEGGNGGADSKKEALKDLHAVKVKIEYMQGEALNLDDLTVTAVYENSSRVLPAGSYTTNVKTININTPGRKILTISYTEGAITKTVDIAIIITQKVDTVTQKADAESQVKKGDKITDKNSAGIYKVTNIASKTPTVEYTGTTKQNKKTITIPEYITYQGVKYKVTGVSAKCFKGSKKLTTVRIASSVIKIGDSAFEGCSGLKTVMIGKGLKTIGKNAFKNCKKLKSLTIKSSKLKAIGKNAFKNIYAKCKIKVPAKKVKAYQKLMKKKGQAATVKIVK